MTYLEKAIELKKKIDANQNIVNIINSAGGLRDNISQSDKVGFNWKITHVGDAVIMREYIEQENPIGIEKNPFPWVDGILMVPNAFYELDGIRKVWTGAFEADATWDDENLVEF